ncbi:MAG: alkaline phosphatase family protein [Planctomycetota bacterium]
MSKVVVLNVVGLTPRLLEHAPRLKALGPVAPLTPPLPAVTSTCQATMLTGLPPSGHGIVANGWYHRELDEVMFWRQSNRLIAGPRPWDGIEDRTAVLFWWFNMATGPAVTITPRPAYPADGRKIPDIHATPPGLAGELQQRHGAFPLFKFWGPLANIESTRWIATAAIDVLQRFDPQLAFVYLPHLDYDLQRLGPDDPGIAAQVRAVDAEAGRILDAADGRRVLVVSEYGITAVGGAIHPNRILREAGLLRVIDKTHVGELIDTAGSTAFAVCDHQLAHVYTSDESAARRALEGVSGIEILDRAQAGLDHVRSGELVLLSAPDRWFAYPYWLDEAKAPDFAPTVDIHRKPGYDPVELFSDASAARIAWILLKKKLGFRALLDVIPADAALVKGSHGRLPADPAEGPLLIGDGDRPRPMSDVADSIRRALL